MSASGGEDREHARERGGERAGGVRVEPTAAVVTTAARVPPATEETPVGVRPVATVRRLLDRLRRRASEGGRSRPR